MYWKTKPFSAAQALSLAKELGLSSLVAGVLVARGINTTEAARRFLNPSLQSDWTAPEDIEGMDEVADALERAIRSDKRICIFGDYDVDGITASAILSQTIRALGSQASVVLPLREGEGYGLSESALERVFSLEPDVVVTVDCGVSSAAEVSLLLERGIEVLVTDHHESSDALPLGIPLADPKLDAENPASILAGAGVALKLSAALSTRFGRPDLWRDFCDLAALGTIADCMPLTGENRALVAEGIKMMNNNPRTSISAAQEIAGKAKEALSAQSLSFGLIPRLNAAGRVSDPLISYDLLCADDAKRAGDLAYKLERLNNERRSLEALLYAEAKEQIDQQDEGRRSIVVGKEGWHDGVKGIVASKLTRDYGVPALVFSFEDALAIGSGRSVGDIDLHAAVSELSDMLLKFGGHKAAVGLTIEKERMDEFAERLDALMQQMPPERFQPPREFDCLLGLEQLTHEAVEELAVLEPCGTSNHEPVFLTQDLMPKSVRFVGSDKNHLSLVLTDGVHELSAVWFNTPYKSIDELPAKADVIYRVQVDEWRGRRKVKAYILDMFESKDKRPTDERADTSTSDQLENLLLNGSAPALNQHIAQVLAGGPLELRNSQIKCLETLEQGKSTLAIMATGRGKSLIFQIHAIKRALKQGAPSLFIYPLRSLINDQEFFLKGTLTQFGLSCASLTGSTTPDERERIYKDVKEGRVSLVLSTPEFVFANEQRLPLWDDFGFVVIDEAHHIATSGTDFRPSYTHLDRLRSLAPHANFLALSATSDKETTESISASLGIESIVIDTSKRSNLQMCDHRDTLDKYALVSEIVSQSPKSLVYVSSRSRAIELCRDLRKDLRALASQIGFYNATLTSADRLTVENAFRGDEFRCIIATSAFGEGVNIPHVRDVVLYDLPYSLIDFNQMSGRAGRDGQEAFVHILAQQTEAEELLAYLAQDAPEQAAAGNSIAEEERRSSVRQLELFADWLFKESSHELSSVIQRPLTPLER